LKIRIFFLLITSGLLLAACAPAAVNETAPTPVEQVATKVMEATQSAAVPTEEPTHEPTVLAEVSFSKDIWPVIQKFALTAHGGKGGVFLESYNDIMKYVVPGSPEESMLYKRLTADGVSQMPPSGPLPSETIKLFYDWIKQGAKNN